MNIIDLIKLMPLVVATLLGLLIIPHMVLMSTPQKTQFFHPDHPEEGQGIPLSGVSFFLIMVLSLCISLTLLHCLMPAAGTEGLSTTVYSLLPIFIGCIFLFLVGLKDDMAGAGDFIKFCTFLLAAVLLPLSGIWVSDLHGLFGLTQLPAYVGMPLTVLLVLYVGMAFSLLDGVEGLCSGFGCLILFVFFVLGYCGNNLVVSMVSATALGIIVGVVILTKVGARRQLMMMGNSGAYVLGYVIGSLSVWLLKGTAVPGSSMMVCIGALILPMLDVLRVLGSRIRDGRDINSPDRNQFVYKLLRTGMSRSLAPLCIALLVGMFVVLNAVGDTLGWDKTLLFVSNVVLWIAVQYFLNWRIHAFEQANHKAEWNKLYGKEAWNSNIPHEVMRHKIETYGTMGLPSHMQIANPIEFIPDGMTGFGRSTKRLWDFFLSIICLVAFSPLFLLCYVLIKTDDGGPVIYRQERIGRFGRPFYIYKFRSMRIDAEKDGPALSHASGEEDPRLTRVGRFLREHHLDELPQLWNVMMGDMAFIGYRPERKYFIDQIMLEDPRYVFLYQIRPGVTSYATLYYGYTDTMEKMLRRLELDLYYLRRRSWWFDCKVLILTFTSIVFGKKF